MTVSVFDTENPIVVKDLFKQEISDHVTRVGKVDIMEWLESSDFFEAPASTRYHGACDGGLAAHSLQVLYCLRGVDEAFDLDLDPESMVICALFHDLCKVGCYKRDTRNVKDERGQWHKVPCYKFEEDFKYGGHGSKSVFLVMHFMNLDASEASAINCHMGQFDSSTYSNASSCFGDNPLAWALHVADEAATHLYEK